MALTRFNENAAVYLVVKHFALWRELKKRVEGCEEIEVTNPKTKEVIRKFGYRFRDVSGKVVKLVKYDTERKYPTRYFGFKMHMQDGADMYVIDLPYNSQVLRRFLRIARNVDWSLPLSLTVFKGKKDDGSEETGVWFQQKGETVKSYYSRETPHGMPEAVFHQDLQQWDFRAQHSWLVERLKLETIPDIEAAARRSTPPIPPEGVEEPAPDSHEPEMPPFGGEIEDDDVPF